MQRVSRLIKQIQKYVDRWWYPPALGALAGADLFIIVVPTDGLMVSSTMLAPRRWISMAFFTALGSSLGALALAAVLEVHGLPFILQLKPGIDQSALWIWTDQIMHQWGGWAIFAVAISPLMQHPAVALAAIAEMPLWEIFAMVFAGRIIKYILLAWISSHAPHYLNKLWGIQGELKEVDISPDQQLPKEPTRK